MKNVLSPKEQAIWNCWTNNFYNAKKFFESKGNLGTRSKLKEKWYKQFLKDIQ